MAFEKAWKFVYEQRIKELQNALLHWPDSPNNPSREAELRDLESKLEEVNKKLLSS